MLKVSRISKSKRSSHSKHRRHLKKKRRSRKVKPSSSDSHHFKNKIHSIDTNNSNQILLSVTNTSFDQTENYHRKRKRKRKNKRLFPWFNQCTCLYLILTEFLVLCFFIILTVILLITLYPSKNESTERVVSLRWSKVGKTIAGITGHFGNGSNQLKYPWSLAIDSLYTLYISDRQNNRVQKYVLPTSRGTTIAGQTNGQSGINATHLFYPGYIYVDSNDDLYVPDTDNHRIQLWSKNAIAGVSGSLGNSSNQLNSPFGVIRDPNTGTIYIADSYNHRIMNYAPGAASGVVVAGFSNGTGGNGSDSFRRPTDITFDVLGNDSEHLQYPSSMVVDNQLNLYVADQFNHRIQLFERY